LTHPYPACIIPSAPASAVDCEAVVRKNTQLPRLQATSVRTPQVHGEVNDWRK